MRCSHPCASPLSAWKPLLKSLGPNSSTSVWYLFKKKDFFHIISLGFVLPEWHLRIRLLKTCFPADMDIFVPVSFCIFARSFAVLGLIYTFHARVRSPLRDRRCLLLLVEWRRHNFCADVWADGRGRRSLNRMTLTNGAEAEPPLRGNLIKMTWIGSQIICKSISVLFLVGCDTTAGILVDEHVRQPVVALHCVHYLFSYLDHTAGMFLGSTLI